MPFVRGNSKIHESVLCFSMPPIETCPNHKYCSGCCYALTSFQQYEYVRNAWTHNYHMARDNQELFENLILTYLSVSDEKVIRLHVAGDFFSQEYVGLWHRIMSQTDKKFYAYTKTMEMLDFSEYLVMDNINLINSMAPDGKPNFGDPIRVYELQQQGYFICPATVKKPFYDESDDVVCGLSCTHCHHKGNNKVVFHQH